MRTMLPCLLALCITVAYGALAQAKNSIPAIEERLTLSDWREYNVQGVTLFSNASRLKGRRMAKKLRRFIALAEKFSKGSSASGDTRPVSIYVFSEHKQFSLFIDRLSQERNIVGYAKATPGKHVLALSLEWPTESTSFLFHEFMHFLQFKKGIRMPAWYQEGEAEFYSSVLLREGVATIGARTSRIKAAAAQSLPLEMMLNTNHTDDLTKKNMARFYADSWAFVHYLNMFQSSDQSRRIYQANEYINLLNQGQSIRIAFKTAFGKSIEAIELEYQQYRKKLFSTDNATAYYQVEFEEINHSYFGRPMSVIEAAQNLGAYALLMGADQIELAAELFDFQLAKAPKASTALMGMSEVEILRGNLDSAAALLSRVDSGGMHEHLLRGHLAMKQFSILGEQTPTPSESSTAFLEQARAAYRQATTLEPTTVDAWVFLGLTYIASEDTIVSPGIDAMDQAARLSPSTPIIYYYLGQLHRSAGNINRARQYFETVLHLDHNSELSKEARQQLNALQST